MVVIEQRRKTNQSEWGFESDRSHVQRMMDPAKASKSLKKISGLSDIRMHDLRRTPPSLATIKGTNLQTVMSMLGHRSIRSTMRYQRLGSTDPARKAMEAALKFAANTCVVPD